MRTSLIKVEAKRKLITPALLASVVAACESSAVAPQILPHGAYRIPATIDATGSSDVSEALRAWLASVPDRARIIGPPGARYRVEFGVLVENRWGLEFDAEDPADPPSLFQTELEPYGVGVRENRNRLVLGFRLGGGHSLRNWVLRGAQPNAGFDGQYIADLEAQHGLLISGVNGITVEDVFITEVAGDFIYLANRLVDGTNTLSRDVVIRRVKGRKAGRQGIAFTGGVNTLVEHSDFQDIRRSASDIEPNSGNGSVQYLVVRHNIFGWFRNAWVAGHGSSEADIHDITFENNEIIGKPAVFQLRGARRSNENPGAKRRYNVRVAYNRAHGIGASISSHRMTVMEFTALDNVEVIGNIVEYDGEVQIQTGAYFNESCGVTYSENDWANARYDHVVTIGYDIDGSPQVEYDGGSLEWPFCPTAGG